jgi:tetratricopeptide (TPR) repeat protein
MEFLRQPKQQLVVKIRHLLLIACLLTAVLTFAQTQRGNVIQKGYAKTKGRLSNDGSHIVGKPISNVTVSVRGRNSVISNQNGQFSISFPGTTTSFFLQDVKKTGYMLLDRDMLSKQYYCSNNELLLVMESESQLRKDRYEASIQIESTLMKQLEEKEAEINRLLEENKITKEKYDTLLQELCVSQDNNGKLVNEMADQYTRMDFDTMDEFNSHIRKLILEGHLTEADSLLNSTGDFNSRKASYRQKKQELEKDSAEWVQYCDNKIDIFKLRHNNDSAAFYLIAKVVDIDSTNVKWLLDAGRFMREYKAEMKQAEQYYRRALNIALSSNDKAAEALCYDYLGSLYNNCQDYAKGIEYMEKALEMHRELFGEESERVASNYCDIGYGYFGLNKYDEAYECFKKAAAIQEAVFGEKHRETATTYNNIGSYFQKMKDFDKAIEWFSKALAITIEISSDEDPRAADYYSNLSDTYRMMKDYDKVTEYAEKAMKIRKKVYGERHYNTANSYLNIGGIYNEQGRYQDALDKFNEALQFFTAIYGENSEDVTYCYNAIGAVYLTGLKDYANAASYFQKALDIRIALYGEKSNSLFKCYAFLGIAEEKLGHLLKALDCYQNAFDICDDNESGDKEQIRKLIKRVKEKMSPKDK